MSLSTVFNNKPGSPFSTIWRLLREFPGSGSTLFWLSLTSLITNLFSLAIPLFFMQIYDRIMIHSSRDTLIWLTLCIILILLLDTGVKILRSRLAAWYAMRFAHHREQLLMKQLYSMPEDEYRTQNHADMSDRFRSIINLQGFYSGQFFQSFLDLPFAAIFILAIYFFGGSIVYYHLIIAGIFILLQLFYYPAIRRTHSRSSESSVKRLAFLREMLEQIHFIKAQACEEAMLRKLDALQQELSYRKKTLQKRKLQPQVIGGILTQLMVYGTIVIGGFMVMNGDITIGVVTAVTMLSRRLIGPLQNYSSFYSKLVQADIDVKRIQPVFEKDGFCTGNLDVSHQLTGELEFRNVSYTPTGNGTVNPLKNVQLRAEQGTVSVIMTQDQGAADAFRDLLLGVRKPDSGRIILDNYILSNIDSLHYTEQIAVLPRRGRLFNGTILENISMFNPNLNIQALDAAALFGLDETIAQFPRGYETEMMTHSNNTVSAGIIQRISLARAFVYRPRVVVSDRSDELMDKETFTRFLEILEKIRENTTVILLTHRQELLNIADCSYLLSDGKLKFISGGPSDGK